MKKAILMVVVVLSLLIYSYLWRDWQGYKEHSCLEFAQAELVGGATVGLVRPCGDEIWSEIWRRN